MHSAVYFILIKGLVEFRIDLWSECNAYIGAESCKRLVRAKGIKNTAAAQSSWTVDMQADIHWHLKIPARKKECNLFTIYQFINVGILVKESVWDSEDPGSNKSPPSLPKK